MNLRIIFLIGLLLASCPSQAWSIEDSSKKILNETLDLTRIKIESPAAREILKKDHIAVRKARTEYAPSGEIPILETVIPKDNESKETLKKLVSEYSGQKLSEREIKTTGNIYVAKMKTASCWIGRSSGSYKFTETADSMAVPTGISDFKKAVQTALDYLGRHHVIELSEAEEVDILFVSAVKNALTPVNEKTVPEKPDEEFISDYYVAFGRRYKGIPVIGSSLVIRLDGAGNVASVQKNWRKISKVGIENSGISVKPLQKIIISDPMFYKKYAAESIGAKDIHIADKKCGYMEAPVNYLQARLRPGCIVSFKIGDKAEEAYPQITISLEDNVKADMLWGERAREDFSDMEKKLISDENDKEKDEDR